MEEMIKIVDPYHQVCLGHFADGRLHGGRILTHTRARTHARTHTHTHKHTYRGCKQVSLSPIVHKCINNWLIFFLTRAFLNSDVRGAVCQKQIF